MKTDFQKRFVIDDVFYTGQQIREAFIECFPFKNSRYQGLARLVFPGYKMHADKSMNLANLIPDIESIRGQPYSPDWTYLSVVEGSIRCDPIVSASFFVPTDLGYMCDRMIIKGRSICSETEAYLWSELQKLR
jgi:hypothetical protein